MLVIALTGCTVAVPTARRNRDAWGGGVPVAAHLARLASCAAGKLELRLGGLLVKLTMSAREGPVRKAGDD